MKPTDFSMHLTAFLSDYLPVQKNVSRNTIKSYRDTFKLLLLFCEKEESLPVEKITMKRLSSDLVERFLNWLETERKSSVSTRNLRLTAIHSFFRYDIKTTEIYARADTELKRKALENAYPELVDSNLPDWSENSDLMAWLSEL